ncbi:hypothetical protein THSYN_09865 [Candidatus Thiodictyon syntrophicum]|uniref:Uncharacterized protein n=1 Tax=Candidatus Thiodictyon syntrophicum TaxID=1166950 RepID=A0A2K8U6R3_9GAMM|nr:hypothetical protein THSYN_09865 [Candidatus Thiodictyon syntrophicum]
MSGREGHRYKPVLTDLPREACRRCVFGAQGEVKVQSGPDRVEAAAAMPARSVPRRPLNRQLQWRIQAAASQRWPIGQSRYHDRQLWSVVGIG